MATQVQVPSLGESVTQAVLIAWRKADGESVSLDEPICELETDKANVDIPAKAGGVLRRLKQEGETVNVGEAIAEIDESAAPLPSGDGKRAITPPPAPPQPAPAGTNLEDLSPAVRRLVEENRLNPSAIPGTGPGGRLTKEDVLNFIQKPAQDPALAPIPAPPPSAPSSAPARPEKPASQAEKPSMSFDASGIHRETVSKIRRRIAERLIQAQQTAAILTTFNEIDLTEVIRLRAKFKDQFEKAHGVGLGFMSFFARAVILALREIPRLNAYLDGDQIEYHSFVNLGLAVSTDRGLAVPVLRNVQEMSFARIEAEIKRLAAATRDGKLAIEELSGATFTITNGGVFGSLLSTPILTPPQTGILGMHAIQKRPVVIDDKIEVRSMMYIALSYDHRLIDGREAITFLVRLKQFLEDPARLMLEI